MNNCLSCKYGKYEEYSQNLCKNPFYSEYKLNKNGNIVKVLKECDDINPSGDCEEFIPNLFGKIGLIFERIKSNKNLREMEKLKRTNPEKFL